MKWLTSRQIFDGERVPNGWGFAWSTGDRHAIFPIPFNRILSGFRKAWHWALTGIRPSAIDRARHQGYAMGLRKGFEQGHRDIDERLRKGTEKTARNNYHRGWTAGFDYVELMLEMDLKERYRGER